MKDFLANRLFNCTIKEAQNLGICIDCKQPYRFTSELGHKEYRISALCESCFDQIFDEEPDMEA